MQKIGLPDGYERPEVKLELVLSPYPHPPTTKTPVFTGYVRVDKFQLAAIEQVLRASEGGTSCSLRVALWENPSSESVGLTGVIEYREYTKKATPSDLPPPPPSKWY